MDTYEYDRQYLQILPMTQATIDLSDSPKEYIKETSGAQCFLFAYYKKSRVSPWGNTAN